MRLPERQTLVFSSGKDAKQAFRNAKTTNPTMDADYGLHVYFIERYTEIQNCHAFLLSNYLNYLLVFIWKEALGG